MAIHKSIFSTFLLLLTLVQCSQCLYEDQIGSFDWRKTFVGSVQFASFDVKRVIVATHENVLAAINLKTGELHWRQLLETSEQHRIVLMHYDGDIITVSGNGSDFFIRTWDANTGALLNEWTLSLPQSATSMWTYNNNQLIHIVTVATSHLEVTHYDSKTGLNKGSTSRISTPWMSEDNCAIANTRFICLSATNSNSSIYTIDLTGDMSKVQTYDLSTFIGDVSGKVTLYETDHTFVQPAVLIKRNNVHRLLLFEETPKLLPYSFESNVISVSNERNLLMQLQSDEKNANKMQLKTIDIDSNEENHVSIDLDPKTSPILMAAICRSVNCRVLVKMAADDAIALIQLPSGKLQWQREEALANVLAAEFVELPLSELESSIEREFNAVAASNVLSMFIKRISSQLRQLSSAQKTDEQSLVRDVFGLHKLIVLATRIGKLYAIDTINGNIIWSQNVADILPFRNALGKDTFGLYQQRTSRYAPHLAQMTLIGKHSGTKSGIKVYSFDPITGQTIDSVTKSNFALKQAMLLPYEDETHLKALILLGYEEDVYVYPEKAKSLVSHHASATFMFTVDSETSIVNGYSLDRANDRVAAVKTWELNLGPHSRIVALGLRPTAERVHSQGRVLADRSVFYKFVNPNLIALATITADVLHRHVLSVYLVDGVTGLIVHSAHHKRANGPVQMVHSENWLVYSYFSERYRRFEVTAVELYEGVRQSNSTHFSSHALSQLPHAETLSYILPVQPVAMMATITERGITSKHVLIAMSNGGVLEMPWAFLEPRGAHMANPEEGIIPYMPELFVHSENIINYNQTLARIRDIQVSPAKLESTCLVVVYGLDLFFTRVMPSKTFDVLKEDFDHWLIVMVLTALTLASYGSKKLSVRKAIKQMWK